MRNNRNLKYRNVKFFEKKQRTTQELRKEFEIRTEETQK